MHTPKQKIRRLILTLLILLPACGYYFCVYIPPRTYTRENTGLERLPPGVAIPMTPDGASVDYVRAYELVFPHLCENPEENGWREIVRYLGTAVFMGEYSPSSEEGWKRALEDFEKKRRAIWEDYCRKLALEPESLSMNGNVKNPEIIGYDIRDRLTKAAMPTRPEDDDEDDIRDEDREGYYKIQEEIGEILWRKLYVTGWDAAEYPEMAEWVAAYDEFLDLAARAVRRERYVLPVCHRGEQEPDFGMIMPPYMMWMPGVSVQRTIWQGFRIRATMYLQRGETERALAEAESLWRLGRHLRRMPTFVSYIYGRTIERSAKELTLEILKRNHLPAERLRAFSEMLDTLPAPVSMEDYKDVEHWWHYECFDSVPMDSIFEVVGTSKIFAEYLPVDYTIAAERYTKLKKMNIEEQDKNKEGFFEIMSPNILKRTRYWLHLWLTRARSERIGELVFWQEHFTHKLYDPANPTHSMQVEADRAECYYHLTRLTVSLKRYKAEHGEYPDSLDALIPEFLTQLPSMPGLTRTEPRPLTYSKKGDGFLLTAVKPDFDPEQELTEEEEEKYYVERLYVIKIDN